MHSPGYSSVIPMRSHLDAYWSLPSSPMSMDPRILSGQDRALAMSQATMSLEAPDYFHHPRCAPSPRYSGAIGSRSPYNGDYELERFTARYEMEIGSLELNRRYEEFSRVQIPFHVLTSEQYQCSQPGSATGKQSDLSVCEIRQNIPCLLLNFDCHCRKLMTSSTSLRERPIPCRFQHSHERRDNETG